MILRNGINSTIRAKGRTALFTLLILALTLVLTLGLGTWAYSTQLLSNMDESYTSIALVEYMGSDYPNMNAADAYARSAAEELEGSAINAIDGVTLWETTERTFASVDGYERKIGEVPYGDYAVLECMQFIPLYTTGMVSYTSDELPQTYIAIDFSTWKAVIQESAEAKSDWVAYYESNELGYYQFTEAGEILYTDITELPESCIVRHSSNYYSEYRFIQNGQPLYELTDRYNQESIRFTYKPEDGSYWGEGQVVRGYTAIATNALYARDADGEFLVTVESGDIPFVPEKGVRYIIHGKFIQGNSSQNAFVLTDFYPGCETAPYQPASDADRSPLFQQYADFYATANSYINLEATDDIGALEVFQQGLLQLQQGRFPEAGEAGVCVITNDIAAHMDIALGDTVSLATLRSDEAERFALTAEESARSLTVVGITSTLEEYYGSIWVSQAEGGYTSPLFGYQLGRAVLENGKARQAADAIQALCPANVRVTLYDQGYSAASEPLETMQSTALALTIASACGAVAVLFLFAYLFVGRQRETVQVLVSLGTPASKIRAWLLSGASLISALAACIGAGIGGAALEHIIGLALSTAQDLYSADLRYSESAVGFVQELSTDILVPVWPALAAGSAVFLLALLLCTAFLSQAKRQSVPKRGKTTVRVPKSGTSTAGRGAARFAFLSIRRGGWRSGIVPAAVLVLCLLVGILASGAEGWSSQLDSLYRDTKIEGQVVSTNGRQDTGLVISAENTRTIWKSGLVEDISYSLGWNYWISSEMPAFGSGAFAEESRKNWISQQPDIIALNDLSAAPEFMHGQSPQITWLDGWDESFLESQEYHSFTSSLQYFQMGTLLPAENEPIPYPCLISESFLNKHSLALGESFFANMEFVHTTWDRTISVELIPVGTFVQLGSDANIYVPLSFWCASAWITAEQDMIGPSQRVTQVFSSNEDRDDYLYFTTSFETCVFTLDQAAELDTFRDYLMKNQFSQVGKLNKNRTTVLLHDQTFVETVGGLGRYISFSQILFPVLFAVVALLGFIISWLMINSRRMEFAILRGLGASRIRVFLSFFLEQALLSAAGCLLSCAALHFFAGQDAAQWQATLVFLICYLIGCALSVIAVGRTHLMSLLSERE